MNQKRTYGVLVLVMAFALFAASCTTSGNNVGSNVDSFEVQSQVLGQAPDFSVTTINGEQVSMESYLDNGKPTIVYFMASWCPVCAKNWPVLDEINTAYGEDVNLVAISIDPTDTDDVLRKLSDDRGLSFPMVKGTPQIMLDFGVKGQATTVGVDANGNILFIKAGEMSFQEYEALISELL